MASTGSSGFTLHVSAGPLEGRELFFEGTKFKIGRTRASSIQIKDPAVSEKHGEIAFMQGEWKIRDLGSSNGTFLNGKEITGTGFLLSVSLCTQKSKQISPPSHRPCFFLSADEFVTFKSGDELRIGTETIIKVEVSHHAFQFLSSSTSSLTFSP